ncbi:MAG: S-methyl-5-thioribose-1-phosphate isomerase [Candidatus Micrarchaeota archaeon]
MPFSKKVAAILSDIQNLKIQGASRVQKAGVLALYETALHSNAKTVFQFRADLQKTGLALFKSRPTEPGLRTAVRIIWKTGHLSPDSLEEAKKRVLEKCRSFSRQREQMLDGIAQIGAALIPKNAVILTHCHSNTVEAVLKKAKKKIAMVYATETRPLFQGRITAANLSKAGIPVTQIVDSAAASFIGKADLFATGCDAILANGNVINKIGTCEISLAAQKSKVPHVVFCSSNAFDPLTFFGWTEPIEERSWKEVWPDKPKNVRVLNPAFDETPASRVFKIVSEHGILRPKEFVRHLDREFDFRHGKKEYIQMLHQLKGVQK